MAKKKAHIRTKKEFSSNPRRKKPVVAALQIDLSEAEKDLLSHMEQGWRLETDSLGDNPVLRDPNSDESVRPPSANRGTVEALDKRGLIVARQGRRAAGTFVAGYFDNTPSADVAIAALGENYREVWSSPNRRTLNPARLSRGPRVGAVHIAGRVSPLFDFDPPRPTGVMSTDAEHEAALEQARDCQSWLCSLGWPPLSLCDSGSGAHLRPIVEMDTSAGNTRLVQRTPWP